MYLTRSQQEAEARRAERESLSKKIAKELPRRVFASRIVEAQSEEEMKKDKEEREWQKCGHCNGSGFNGDKKCPYCNKGYARVPKPPKKEASAQEKALGNQSIHKARNVLREAGLHNISLHSAEVRIAEADRGARKHFIKDASIRLTASVPFSDGQRVSQKRFAVNLSYSQGKYSVDSLEKNDQILPVNKGSLSKILAMEDRKAQDDLYGNARTDSRIDQSESQVQPSNIEDQHSNFDANVDVNHQAHPPTNFREGSSFSEGDSVKIVGPVNKKGKVGIIHQVSPQGNFYGVEDSEGNHLGYFHESDIEKSDTDESDLPSEQHTSEYGQGDRFGVKKKVEAQSKFPLKYRGHTIKVKGDDGGGHKGLVYKGNELRHITKRHAAPENAANSAKLWVEDQSPAKDEAPKEREGGKANPFAVCTKSVGREDKEKYDRCVKDVKKKGQAFLQNPESSKVVQADPELEELRRNSQQIQATIQDLQAKVQSYADALAAKASQESGVGDPSQGMLGFQSEAMRINGELQDKLKSLPENFVQFVDGVIYAKVQTTRLNDAAWGQVIEAAKTRGKGVMKRVAAILDRVAILFQKLTANVALKEYAPGTFTPKEQAKIVKKNVDQSKRIDQYQQDQSDVGQRSQKYFLDKAGETGNGKIGVPGSV